MSWCQTQQSWNFGHKSQPYFHNLKVSHFMGAQEILFTMNSISEPQNIVSLQLDLPSNV
jgi:hypothetical protein